MRLELPRASWIACGPIGLLLVACGDVEPRTGGLGADGVPAEAMGETSAVEPRTPPGGSEVVETVADAPTVVFVGTSLTAGFGLPDPGVEAWPARVADLARAAGAPIHVVNAGVSGDTSAGGLRRIVRLLDPPPSVVVLELGANDGLRGLPVADLERNLGAAVDSLRLHAPSAAIVVARMEAPRNLGAEYVDAFAAVYDSLATRPGVVVTPFLLDGVAGVPALNQADGIHPVAEGHRRMAEIVWPILRARLLDAGDMP